MDRLFVERLRFVEEGNSYHGLILELTRKSYDRFDLFCLYPYGNYQLRTEAPPKMQRVIWN